MNRLLAFLSLLVPLCSIGQYNNNSWLAQHRGEKRVRISQLEVDGNGNALVATNFDKKYDGVLQTKSTSAVVIGNDSFAGYPNLTLSQYNQEGNINWYLTLKSKDAIYASSLKVDHENNYYLGGSFKHDAFFASTDGKSQYIPFQMLESHQRSYHRFYIAKYTNKGELLWVKTGLSWDHAFCRQLICDKKGNVYAWVYAPSPTLVFDDYIFQNINGRRYIGRNYFVLAKIDKSGTIQWITRTGDNIQPKEIRFNNNDDIELLSIASIHEYSFLYLDGTETKIDDSDKFVHNTMSKSYIISSKTGKITKESELISDDYTGYPIQTFPSKNGLYTTILATRQPNNSLQKIELGLKRFTLYRRGKMFALSKLDSKGKIDWSFCIKADMDCNLLDVEEMANGIIYVLASVQGKSTFIHSNGDSTSYPYYRNTNFVYLIKLDKNGKLLDKRKAGSYASVHETEIGFLASNGGEKLYMANNFAFTGRYLGKPIYVKPRDPNYEHRGSYLNGYLSFNPFSKDSIDLFKTDTSKYENYASAADTLNKELPAAFKIDTSHYENDTLAFSSDTFFNDNKIKVALKFEVSLFPNPIISSNPDFYLVFTANEKSYASLNVININGEILRYQSVDVEEGTNEIHVQLEQRLVPGVYLIQINYQKKQVVKRLVVN